MDIQRAIKHPIESFRTAPLWLTRAAAGAVFSASSLWIGIHMIGAEDTTVKQGALTGITAGAVGAGVLTVRRDLQEAAYYHEVRDSAEAAFGRRDGYSEAYASRRLGVWCVRQATLVACEQFGDEAAQQYKALIDANRSTIAYGNIPHI